MAQCFMSAAFYTKLLARLTDSPVYVMQTQTVASIYQYYLHIYEEHFCPPPPPDTPLHQTKPELPIL
jgi:hypothetical protein